MLELVSIKEILVLRDVGRKTTSCGCVLRASLCCKIIPICVTESMDGGVGGETVASRRKGKEDESRIPVPSPGVFRRSASLRLRGERPSPRLFPAHISESGQSCSKAWPSRPSNRHRSQVSSTRVPRGSLSHHTDCPCN